MNPGPETGLNARKFGFKARTKYGVYNYFQTNITNVEFDVLVIVGFVGCELGHEFYSLH